MSNIVVGEYIGKSIRPVRDEDYVGQPVIGYIVKDERGWFAITARDECERFDNFGGAVLFVERKCRK